MKFSCMLLLVTLFCLPALVGCGSDEAQSPTVDELSQFLDDNPEIAAEEENMGGIEDE